MNTFLAYVAAINLALATAIGCKLAMYGYNPYATSIAIANVVAFFYVTSRIR